MHAVYVLYVCPSPLCMPSVYPSMYALCVSLYGCPLCIPLCMPCIHISGTVEGDSATYVYMYALYVCSIFLPCMNVSGECIRALICMCLNVSGPLYVCLICMPYMYVFQALLSSIVLAYFDYVGKMGFRFAHMRVPPPTDDSRSLTIECVLLL